MVNVDAAFDKNITQVLELASNCPEAIKLGPVTNVTILDGEHYFSCYRLESI